MDSAWVLYRNVKLTSPPARFVPFAIFVSAATIVLLLALCVLFHFRFEITAKVLNWISRLFFGLKKANPISTRIELGCLGLDGILWLGKITAMVPPIQSLRDG